MFFNKAIIAGNVGNDPVIRTSNNVKFASLSVATTERYTDRNGETRELTEWHRIKAYRTLAEFIEKNVKKGVQVLVEGSLRTREWKDTTGATKYITEIDATNIQLLGAPRAAAQAPAVNGAPAAAPAPAPAAAAPKPQPMAADINADGDDDLPF